MAFASCGGKLYATNYDALAVRKDGLDPSWRVIYRYPGPLAIQSSGWRGLTCVPKPDGTGFMLIAALEGPGDVWKFPLDGSRPTVELDMRQFVTSHLGVKFWYGIVAYNTMDAYPAASTPGCPALVFGLGFSSPSAPSYEGWYRDPLMLIRHCTGTYELSVIKPPVGADPISARAVVSSKFPGDPAGTVYAGGFDAHDLLNHNTDWIYRGRPQ